MDDVRHDRTREQHADRGTANVSPVGVPELVRPGDALRSLPDEARQRGTRLVSAKAMQARLFSVYDAAAAAEDALALVQEQLTLTLNRSYYEADEIETTAARLDALLTPSVVSRNPATPRVEAPGPEVSATAEVDADSPLWVDFEGVDADSDAPGRSSAE
jgi:hypothetical protein